MNMRIIFSMLAFAMICGLLSTHAGQDEKARERLAGQIDAIAKAIEKGDMAAADKFVKIVAKEQEEVYEPMLLFKPRHRKGFGVGKVANQIIPDGIEIKIRVLARDELSKEKLKEEAEALIEMAYRTAALALVAEEFTSEMTRLPNRPFWENSAQYQRQTALDLIDAVKKRDTAVVKKMAGELDRSCVNCHRLFQPAPPPVMLPVRKEKAKLPAGQPKPKAKK